MERLPNCLKGIDPPPFDDPRYVARCNASWRHEWEQEMEFMRRRWKTIVLSCLGGEYGRDVKDDWQSEYPGMNPEEVCDDVLMQAAQAVWKLKGSKCIEKMPIGKTWSGCPSEFEWPEPLANTYGAFDDLLQPDTRD